MKKFREKESVTPSGVPFIVRNLIGGDQRILSENEKGGNGFNVMLAGALLKLGDVEGDKITPAFVERMLANDRRFALVTLRQHTLKYNPVFNFNYEWPLEQGSRDKDVQEYEVNFNQESFPCIPYYWVREEIEKIKEKNPDYDVIKDGFPKMFESYEQVIEKRTITGTLPESEEEYEWYMLDGTTERNFQKVLTVDNITSNTQLEMRRVKVKWINDTKKNAKPVLVNFDIDSADMLDVEHIRKEIRGKEGLIDTWLTIRNQTNARKETRVDLVSLPAFFFPSQAL